MNWNKAKTILIIAFVITNIFLYMEIYNNDIDNYEGLDENFIKYVENELKENSILIETEIPKEIIKLPLLEVEYNIIEEEQVKKILGYEYTEKISEKLYEKADGSFVKIENNKKMIYNIREIDEKSKIDIVKAEEFLKQFINKKDINLDDYILDFINEKEKTYEITYKKIYNNYKLENDYYKFIIDNLGVVGYEKQTINNIESKEGLIYVTSAHELILRLKYNNYNEKKVIKNVEICYYTDESKEEWENIVRANMDPVWKVLFEDGSVEYLLELE